MPIRIGDKVQTQCNKIGSNGEDIDCGKIGKVVFNDDAYYYSVYQVMFSHSIYGFYKEKELSLVKEEEKCL